MLTFRFERIDLQQLFVALLNKNNVQHLVKHDGSIAYSPNDIEIVENIVLPKIRRQLLSDWQLLFCPAESLGSYKHYMDKHSIPYIVEVLNQSICFSLPKRYRPLMWKIM